MAGAVTPERLWRPEVGDKGRPGLCNSYSGAISRHELSPLFAMKSKSPCLALSLQPSQRG